METKALALMRDAKRKWENAEKEKVAQLNKHIEAQTSKITELCFSNNEMSSRLQRTECELQTANAELDKLRAFQVSVTTCNTRDVFNATRYRFSDASKILCLDAIQGILGENAGVK